MRGRIFDRYIISPGRIRYIKRKKRPVKSCLFCQAVEGARGRKLPAKMDMPDTTNYVIKEYRTCLVLVNPYGYVTGHVQIIPKRHIADTDSLCLAEVIDIWYRVLPQVKRALSRAYGVRSFNIGINLGREAGASIPDHLHIHVVPRGVGEVGFMETTASVRVVPEDPEQTMRRLAEHLYG
jgi:ATP adenylyltransferase